MERMVLGRTGLETYRLGFGGIPIQRVSEAEAVETVRHAVERGVDFIDTSRAYGTSERRIGLALKQVGKEKADRVRLASKSHARKAGQARADLETSLKELDRDYIDLYQCHFVSSDADYRTVTSPGGALDAYRKAKEEGLIGHIGISGHSLDVLARAVDDELFDTVMVCFSVIEPEAREKVILKALERNIGVIAMKPFSGGVIDNARLALKWTLAEPGVLVIAGVEHPHLFDENWRVFGDAEPLTEADEREIVALRAGHDKVFCRRCDYCQPCSEDIPIQTVLGVRSMVKRMGKDALQGSQFWDAINLGRNCTECGECMTRCPYELPIPELIRENLRWLDEAAEGE
jgi:predicted aldo/keto reductase-like oxidoreductase